MSFEANRADWMRSPECLHVDDVERDAPRGGESGSWRLPIVVPGASCAVVFPRKSEKARGSCRSRGRQERAHRSLENRKTGFPQLPQALSSFTGNRKSVTHVPG
jgi:hypothetical protein